MLDPLSKLFSKPASAPMTVVSFGFLTQCPPCEFECKRAEAEDDPGIVYGKYFSELVNFVIGCLTPFDARRAGFQLWIVNCIPNVQRSCLNADMFFAEDPILNDIKNWRPNVVSNGMSWVKWSLKRLLPPLGIGVA